jgi:hypothetical protein
MMLGAWPGYGSVGGTGNVITSLPPAEQALLNATHALVASGAGLWVPTPTSSLTRGVDAGAGAGGDGGGVDDLLLQWQLVGNLLDAGPGGAASTMQGVAPGVNGCGDVHVCVLPAGSEFDLILLVASRAVECVQTLW